MTGLWVCAGEVGGVTKRDLKTYLLTEIDSAVWAVNLKCLTPRPISP